MNDEDSRTRMVGKSEEVLLKAVEHYTPSQREALAHWIKLHSFDLSKQVVIIWSVEDVQFQGDGIEYNYLTTEQCMEILERAVYRVDHTCGFTWDYLSYITDMVCEENNWYKKEVQHDSDN